MKSREEKLAMELIELIDKYKKDSEKAAAKDDEITEKFNYIKENSNDKDLIVIAIEEMAELTQCLTKFLRKREVSNEEYNHLHEEFADVVVCMNHLINIFEFDEGEITERMLYKLDRTIERMKGKNK